MGHRRGCTCVPGRRCALCREAHTQYMKTWRRAWQERDAAELRLLRSMREAAERLR